MTDLGIRLERHLHAVWYEGRRPGPLGPILIVLAGVHAGVLAVRRALDRLGARRPQPLPVPVIVVGNRTVGGTGKTPLVLALVEHFRAQGRRPGVVSRGYGRRSHGQVRVEPDTPAEMAGDEPALIASRTRVPVCVDRDRVQAAWTLVAAGCDLIIADDGLQHRRLGRTVEIEVIDAARGYGNGRLLPAGPLREPPAPDFPGLRVSTGIETEPASPAPTDPAQPWPMRLRPLHLRGLRDDRRTALTVLRGRRVHAVAGIGNPERFFRTLRRLAADPIEHPFPDHHRFVPADLHFATSEPIVMTEKDAIKCRDFDLPEAHWLEIAADLPAEFLAALDRHLSGARDDPSR